MKVWTKIQRSKPDVLGVDEQYPGLLRVSIRLDPAPPEEWRQFFSNPVGVEISLGMHPPELGSRDSVVLLCPDTELKKYVQHVDARIASANERYEREVVPKKIAAEQRAADEREKRRTRVEQAREVAEGL